VDQAYGELCERAYALNSEPFEFPPARLVTLNDPDGNISA
jgi:hypothetical protein